MKIYFYVYYACQVRGLRSVNLGAECTRFVKGDKPFILPSECKSGTGRGVKLRKRNRKIIMEKILAKEVKVTTGLIGTSMLSKEILCKAARVAG